MFVIRQVGSEWEIRKEERDPDGRLYRHLELLLILLRITPDVRRSEEVSDALETGSRVCKESS